MDGQEIATIPGRTPGGSYNVVLGEGVLDSLGRLMAERGLSGKAAIIADDTVAGLYAEQVAQSLREAGFAPAVLTFPAGEAHKNLDTVRRLYDALVEARLERGNAVVALGGGVVGDTAGFVAATFLRGVPLVQVPTTLLAMVDSSVGGKVGVDLPQGKNLVGAFKQPALVVADVTTLETLPEQEVCAGLAEVIKAGIIGDATLFEHLEHTGREPLGWVIRRAIEVKRDVVQEDPFERGRRAVLNLGHTFGHALEALNDYRMLHGFAISIGMAIAARVAVALELAEPRLETRITGTLQRYGLPVWHTGVSPKRIWETMGTDKKRHAGTRRYVLPRAIGDVIVTADVPKEIIMTALRETCELQSADPAWTESESSGNPRA
ncbi:MAG: 3-dehydroquinate synthase [Chloroflexi bacterium]|nr:MAG: 3-dehydroquinate synthase [Chloroflexota bacterium]